jgi:FkbM family methyltransferase
MRLMQLIVLRRFLPKPLRNVLRQRWNDLLGWEQDFKERKFYGRLVGRGDLVFDIGANKGGKVAAFLALGTRVVAVEPSADCTDHMRIHFRDAIAKGQLQIEPAAVASKNGELALIAIDPDSGMYSGSPDFVKYAETIGYTGARAMKVKAVTLDDLVQRYGMPHFIKIDVEGMDAEALRGLSGRSRFLSFEYHTTAALWNNTRECLDHIIRLGFTEANFTEFVSPKFLFQSWIGIDAALSQLEKWRTDGTHWGDVVVR